MGYKVKFRGQHKKGGLPKGLLPLLVNLAAVVTALILAITLPRPSGGMDWVLVAGGGMLGAGAALAAVTWLIRAALGKRAKSPMVAGAVTFVYRVCFVLATCGLVTAFYRVAFR